MIMGWRFAAVALLVGVAACDIPFFMTQEEVAAANRPSTVRHVLPGMDGATIRVPPDAMLIEVVPPPPRSSSAVMVSRTGCIVVVARYGPDPAITELRHIESTDPAGRLAIELDVPIDGGVVTCRADAATAEAASCVRSTCRAIYVTPR